MDFSRMLHVSIYLHCLPLALEFVSHVCLNLSPTMYRVFFLASAGLVAMKGSRAHHAVDTGIKRHALFPLASPTAFRVELQR